jgi:hypothetical protein
VSYFQQRIKGTQHSALSSENIHMETGQLQAAVPAPVFMSFWLSAIFADGYLGF